MDDAFAVGFVEGVGHLSPVTKRLLERQGPFFQAVGERLAFDVLHHQEVGAVFFSDVVKGTDVRVIQGRHCSSLALESLAEPSVVGEMGGQHFDSHGAVEARVLRLVDLAHAAGANGREDLVVAESRSSAEFHGHR